MKHFAFFLFVVSFFSLSVPARAADTFPPTIGTVSPGEATVGTAVILTATVNDTGGSGISTCRLYVDNDDVGAMTVSGNLASRAHTFPAPQIYTVFVFCRDHANNFNSGANSSVWAKIGPGGGGDAVPPSVSAIEPRAATVGVPVRFTATVSDSGTDVTGCQLVIAGASQGTATVSGGIASFDHVFAVPGSTTVYMQCTDGAGNTGYGINAAVSVNAAPAAPDAYKPPVSAAGGGLIKIECPAGARVDHPCKAVYYAGNDGKRHAFPNEKIYFTWYADFSSVTVVSQDAMSNIPLGKNVTYRPGARMVKFPSVTRAYAVAARGVLRWVKTEEDAKALYGTSWSKNVDDLSEALFTDYSYGADITPNAPFSPPDEMKKAITIDDTF